MNPIELNPFILYQKSSFFSIGSLEGEKMKIIELYLMLQKENLYDEFINYCEERRKLNDKRN